MFKTAIQQVVNDNGAQSGLSPVHERATGSVPDRVFHEKERKRGTIATEPQLTLLVGNAAVHADRWLRLAGARGCSGACG
jgi:hypothetical protein